MLIDKATFLEIERKRKKRKKAYLRITSYLIIAFLIVLTIMITMTNCGILVLEGIICFVVFIGASESLYQVIRTTLEYMNWEE